MEHGPLMQKLAKEIRESRQGFKIDPTQYIVMEGELIKELQEDGNVKYKLGDGITPYSDLPYLIFENSINGKPATEIPPIHAFYPYKQVVEFQDLDTGKRFKGQIYVSDNDCIGYKKIEEP